MPRFGPSALTGSVYQTIAKRMALLNPSIRLGDHMVVSSLKAKDNTLDGIEFEPKIDRISGEPTLLRALRIAKDAIGQPAFVEGHAGDPSEPALSASFAETKGRGFREIWRFRLTDRPLRWASGRPGVQVPSLDAEFSAQFGDDITLPDLSSLHCAVSIHRCNVHIDEMGFVMANAAGEVMLSPDLFRHVVVELLWKTKLRRKIPDWAVDRINLIVPSAPNRFSKVGISYDMAKSEKAKISITGACGWKGGFNCSGTLNFVGLHDLGGGWGK